MVSVVQTTTVCVSFFVYRFDLKVDRPYQLLLLIKSSKFSQFFADTFLCLWVCKLLNPEVLSKLVSSTLSQIVA